MDMTRRCVPPSAHFSHAAPYAPHVRESARTRSYEFRSERTGLTAADSTLSPTPGARMVLSSVLVEHCGEAGGCVSLFIHLALKCTCIVFCTFTAKRFWVLIWLRRQRQRRCTVRLTLHLCARRVSECKIVMVIIVRHS